MPVCYRHPRRETYVRCSRCDRPICPDCMNEASVGHQCPECVAEGRRTQRPGRTDVRRHARRRQGLRDQALIAINIAGHGRRRSASAAARGLFGGGLGGLLGGATAADRRGRRHRALDTYQNTSPAGIFRVPAGVADGEFYRLFTSMFLHYGLLHLLMNMWALWVLGRNLEAALGPLRFRGAVPACPASAAASRCYVFTPAAASAGASGAIFGLFAALFIVLRRLGRDTSSIIPVLVINLVFSFVPGISLAGHLGGLVTGAVVAVALAYAPRKSGTRSRGRHGRVAAGVHDAGGRRARRRRSDAMPVPPGFSSSGPTGFGVRGADRQHGRQRLGWVDAQVEPAEQVESLAGVDLEQLAAGPQPEPLVDVHPLHVRQARWRRPA